MILYTEYLFLLSKTWWKIYENLDTQVTSGPRIIEIRYPVISLNETNRRWIKLLDLSGILVVLVRRRSRVRSPSVSENFSRLFKFQISIKIQDGGRVPGPKAPQPSKSTSHNSFALFERTRASPNKLTSPQWSHWGPVIPTLSDTEVSE